MKFGVNTFIWSESFDRSQLLLLPRVKAAGFDGVEVPLFQPAEFATEVIAKGLAENSLGELHLRDEGVVVLGITRLGGDWIGAPDGDTVLHAGDVLVVYGREDRVCELDNRRGGAAGDTAHAAAVAEQQRLEAEEDARDAVAVT